MKKGTPHLIFHTPLAPATLTRLTGALTGLAHAPVALTAGVAVRIAPAELARAA